MFKMIAADIMVEELNKICRCECCGQKNSEYLYLCKEGVFNVLSHVCGNCKKELNICVADVKKEFMHKDKGYPIR